MHNYARRGFLSQLFHFVFAAGLVLIFAPSGHANPAAQEESVPFVIGPILPDPSRNVVYVVDGTYNRLLAINTDTGTQTAAASIDDGATEGNLAVSVDGTKLYLAESTEDEILVFSLPDLTQVATLSLDGPPFFVAAGTGGRLYASTPPGATQDNGTVIEVSTTDGSTLQTLGTGYYDPMIRTDATGTHLYTAEMGLSGQIDLDVYNISGATASAATSYPVMVDNLLDLEPDATNNVVYLMNGGIYGVNVLKLATDNSNTTWPLIGAYGESVSFNNSASVVFGAAGDPYTGDIREYNRANGTPLADWVVATNAEPIPAQGIAATANNNVVYVRSQDGFDAAPPFILGMISSLGKPITLVPSITQTVTFPTVIPGAIGQTVTLPATSSANLTITYTVVSGPGMINGDVLTFYGSGPVVIKASQAGNSVVKPLSTEQTLVGSRGHQLIASFGVIPNQMYGNMLTITTPNASSGLPVTLSLKSGPATMQGNTLTFTGTGAVTIAADQAGNADYYPASEVSTSFLVNKANQTLTPFTPISSTPANTAPFAITLPTSSAGLPVTVAVKSGPATLSGNMVTITGFGTVVLTANQPGNADYNAAPQMTVSFATTKAPQTLTPLGPFSAQTSADTLTITPPTASSGLPVTITVKGPATLSGNVVTFTGTGSVVLSASQAGNATYFPALTETATIAVTKTSQTISAFTTIPDTVTTAPAFSVTTPTASSGLPVKVAVQSGPAKLTTSNMLTVTGSGTVTLVATQPGNALYLAASNVLTSFTVTKQTQTIASFAALPAATYSATPVAVAVPTSSSNLPVTLSVLSGPGKLSANHIVASGTGTVTIAANQAGNTIYGPAPQVTTTLVINPAAQTIAAFKTIANVVYGKAPFVVTAPVATSKLPVTLSVFSGPATISGTKVTITGTGPVVLAADQAGNADYTPATEVTTTFQVTKAPQTIARFATIPAKTASTAPFAITPPVATSKLPVALSVLSGPATISGDTITLTGSGTVTLAADQPGDSDYNAAVEVTTQFVVH